MSAVPTDEIYDKYLQKAIAEINGLGDEIAQVSGGVRVPVLGSGHPLADIMLLKHAPQPQEVQEGVAFFGRSGQAVLKSLQRLHVDPMAIYGTNCLKFVGEDVDEARPFLTRELHIVGPKLIVVMGEPALAFLNELEFPLADRLGWTPGELQRFTPTIAALATPDIDASLDEQPAKTAFWNAFKQLGPWWASSGEHAHHGPSCLKAFPERRLRRLLVEGRVDVGGGERGDRRREALHRASGAERVGERELELVFQERERRLAHQRRSASGRRCASSWIRNGRLVDVLADELEAVRAVDRHQVDVQPLQRLEHRLSGAARRTRRPPAPSCGCGWCFRRRVISASGWPRPSTGTRTPPREPARSRLRDLVHLGDRHLCRYLS